MPMDPPVKPQIFPNELIVRIGIYAEPSVKNAFFKVNKALYSFSFENPNPFLLCPQFNAHPRDIQALFIQAYHAEDTKMLEKLHYHPHIMNENLFYGIVGERIQIHFPRDERGNIFLSNTQDHDIIFLGSLTHAAISRRSSQLHSIHNYLQRMYTKNLKGLTHDVERACSVIIQNNDSNSLEILLKKRRFRAIFNTFPPSVAHKFLQLTVYCASNQVIATFSKLYRYLYTRDEVTSSEPENFSACRDWIKDDFNPNDQNKKENLLIVIQDNFDKLVTRNTDNNRLNRFHECLFIIFDKEKLKELTLSEEEIRAAKNRIKARKVIEKTKEKKGKQSIKCCIL